MDEVRVSFDPKDHSQESVEITINGIDNSEIDADEGENIEIEADLEDIQVNQKVVPTSKKP